MLIVIIVIVVLVIVGVLIVISVNNSMIGARNRVDEAWSGIDVQLKRRHDLVPNLVETVKGYATHEREVFEKVTEARAEAMPRLTTPAESAPEGRPAHGCAHRPARRGGELPRAARDGELPAALTNELTEIEDEIQASRRIYNSNVQAYNTKIQVFPNSIIANNGGFTPREFFEIEDAGDREPVQVSFSS